MSLKKTAIKGVQWTSVSTIINVGTQFVQVAILARLLSPTDFGLVGMVMIIVGFAQMFSDMGISAAIIHYQDIKPNVLSTLYWLNIVCGVVIWAVLILITPLVVTFFHEPELKNLFVISSLNFLIIPIGQQFQTLLEKELKFNRIAKIEIASVIVSRSIAIVLALLNYGVYSLVWGRILTTFLRSILLVLDGVKIHRPRFHFSYNEDIKKILSFGLYKMAQLTLNYFGSRFDQILIGKFLGATILGYYSIAFELVLQPLKHINPVINRVLFPVYARLQNDAVKLKEIFFQSLKYLDLVTFPLLFGLIALTKLFVLTVYGKDWLEIIPLIQISSLAALLIISNNPFGSVVLATGRADIAFNWDLGVLAFRVLTIILTIKYGIFYIAWGLVVVNGLFKFASYLFVMKPMLGPCAKEMFIDTFLLPVLYSSIMCGILIVVTNAINGAIIMKLVTGCALGVASYIGILFVFERQTMMALSNYVISRMRPATI
jgi:lipopolysaccharide exporter